MMASTGIVVNTLRHYPMQQTLDVATACSIVHDVHSLLRPNEAVTARNVRFSDVATTWIIPCIPGELYGDVYWTEKEMKYHRKQHQIMVMRGLRRFPEVAQSIAILLNWSARDASGDNVEVAAATRILLACPYRGLERYFVPEFNSQRTMVQRLVLSVQQEARVLEPGARWRLIQAIYTKAAASSVAYARKMALIDEQSVA